MENLDADIAAPDGIEANDLAGLLTQFEEATSSVDDIAVPSVTCKRKRSILMKAKSCGSSPAVTPPATPPPFFPRQNICFKTQAVGQKSLLVKNQSDPLQFTIVVPSSIVQTQKHIAPVITTLSSQHPSPSTALIVTPKSLLQNTQATKLAVHTNPMLQIKDTQQLHNIPSTSTVLIKPGTREGVKNITPMPVLVTSVSAVPSQPLKANQTLVNQSGAAIMGKTVVISPSTSSPFQAQQPLAKPTINLLNMPIIDSGISQGRKIPIAAVTPKAKAIVPKNNLLVAQTKVVSSAVTSGTSTTSSQILQSTKKSENLPSSTVGGSPLLQSILTKHSTSLMNSKLTSTSVFSQNNLPLTQMNLSDSKTPPESSSNTSTSESKDKMASSIEPSSSAVSQDIVLSFGEHAYCSSPASSHLSTVAKEEDVDRLQSYLNPEVSEFLTSETESALVTNVEQKVDKQGDMEFEKQSEKSSSKDKPIDEFVFEEGEVQVDVDGNDILNPRVDSSPTLESGSANDLSSTRAVSFCKTNAPSSSRRGRRYRRRAELSNSPIREDTSNFFDKIPSHYTVLSIPKKPTKTTAFESTTKALGSMDHLELSNVPEVSAGEGHYDKVPAYRSIFTNTTKELSVTTEPDAQELEEEIRERSHRSSSQHSHRSRSSHRSYRSGSRNSSGARSMHSVSRSPDARRGQSRYRSGRNRRSCSQFSSCSSSSGSSSSGSYCSTCGASLSRSRSRSYSSGGSCERSLSRSRSRSPGQDRDREMRRRRRIRSYTPEGRGFRSSSRSHSRSPRSFSPARQRAMRFGRSQRHRTKSRSSSERRIMERRKEREDEKIRAMEERRVVYVGKIPEGYTKIQLKRRFERFGEIKAVKINFREHGDNYGFITFSYACDAIAAKEKGNNIPGEQRFDLCFGGRRHFCPDQYADLDGNREIEEEYAPMPKKLTEELDYAALLRQHQSQQRKKR